VIGYQPFLGLKIYLDSKPLIPRPETEWWTEELLHSVMSVSRESRGATAQEEVIFQQKNIPLSANGLTETSIRFLDLCAGSGAVGCAALAKLPSAKVYFGEIDPAHEQTILKNIRENKLDESRATIGIGNLFEPFGDVLFDVIAANPPYIPSVRALDSSVTEHEPSLALFAGDDGLDVIRRIAHELPNHLAKDGIAWIEVDSAHVDAACALFTDQDFEAHVINDPYERPRVLVVTF
jgi:HemK-like putative methylase